jgi:two-component system, chemotaxis family, chemotaxis protein CheY
VAADWQKPSDSGRLIAIVEDDAQLISLFQDTLERDERWSLCFFSDGQDAMDHLPDLGAHLILLDVGLPNLDGVSLYKILRGHSNTKSTPIIVITGSYDWELQRMGLQTGLLLRKPFRLQELLFMIQAVLGDESPVQS